MKKTIQWTECPRDAMQGIQAFIPTNTKIEYIQQLLSVNFDVLDVGSFVSPKAIPQMQDTTEVLKRLDLSKSKTKLLTIVANERGAEEACQFDQIDYLGFPFSISETFQKRNTNASIDDSFILLEKIQNTCIKNKKELCVYISMAFGNPYGDSWHEEIATKWAEKLYQKIEVKHLSLADTIGVSNPKSIQSLFLMVTQALRDQKVRVGAHLHTLPHEWEEKMEALIQTECDWIDGAIKGYGGCPMAKDELTGNMPTEHALAYLQKQNFDLTINRDKLLEAIIFAEKVFNI